MKEEKKIRKKIKIEDLLPRDPVRVDLDAILDYVQAEPFARSHDVRRIDRLVCRNQNKFFYVIPACRARRL